MEKKQYGSEQNWMRRKDNSSIKFVAWVFDLLQTYNVWIRHSTRRPRHASARMKKNDA